jgi:hypothetical protein
VTSYRLSFSESRSYVTSYRLSFSESRSLVLQRKHKGKRSPFLKRFHMGQTPGFQNYLEYSTSKLCGFAGVFGSNEIVIHGSRTFAICHCAPRTRAVVRNIW